MQVNKCSFYNCDMCARQGLQVMTQSHDVYVHVQYVCTYYICTLNLELNLVVLAALCLGTLGRYKTIGI